jgi:hypothetical protein
MDWWILKQLRAMVLSDLREFIPQGYFESEVEKFKLHDSIENAKHLSHEQRWGYLAGKLGHELFFRSTAIMSARQVSASEVLMNLGLLAFSEARHGSLLKISQTAKAVGIPDGNAETVLKLEYTHRSTLSDNAKSSLEQYLRYLPPLEKEPFLQLLPSQVNETFPPHQIKQENPMNQTTNNFYAPVGAVQTAKNATANVQQWMPGESSALAEALQHLRTAIGNAPELNSDDKDELTSDIDKVQAELKTANPSQSRLLKWLGGIGAVVQTIGSAQPALEVVCTAAKALGLPL